MKESKQEKMTRVLLRELQLTERRLKKTCAKIEVVFKYDCLPLANFGELSYMMNTTNARAGELCAIINKYI